MNELNENELNAPEKPETSQEKNEEGSLSEEFLTENEEIEPSSMEAILSGEKKDKQGLEEAKSEVEESFKNTNEQKTASETEIEEFVETIKEAAGKNELAVGELIDVFAQLSPETIKEIEEEIKEISLEDIHKEIRELREQLNQVDVIAGGKEKRNETQEKKAEDLEAKIMTWLVKLAIKMFKEMAKAFIELFSGGRDE